MERQTSTLASPSRTAPTGGEHSIMKINTAPRSEMDDPEANAPSTTLDIEYPPHDSAANPQNRTPSRKALIFESLSTTISAGLYIFDFVSNVLVAKQYYYFDFRGETIEGIIRLDFQTRAEFTTIVAAMVIGHIGCGITFITADLPRKEHPLLSAYFLPLVQFRRLLSNLWNPLSKGSSAPNEGRVEALYAIVSAAIEGGPLLIIQYSVLAKYTTQALRKSNNHAPPLLILSLVLSAVSATYNVVRAMVFIIPIRSICLGLATGLFTFSSLLLQCTTVVSLVVAALYRPIRQLLPAIYALLTLLIPFIGFYFLTWQTSSQSSSTSVAKSVGKAAGFAYVSASFGPLYPLVSFARTNSTMVLSTNRFRVLLFLFAAYQMMLEVIAGLVLKRLDFLSPCPGFYGFEQGMTVLQHLRCSWESWGSNLTRLPPECSWSTNRATPFMTCAFYIASLICGFALQILSGVALALVVRCEPPVRCESTDGLQTVRIPDVSTADGAFDSFTASFNIVDCCWGDSVHLRVRTSLTIRILAGKLRCALPQKIVLDMCKIAL